MTPNIRFAAHAFTTRVPDTRLHRAVTRPSYVEAFPTSYTPELVAQAEALLVRMAEVETATFVSPATIDELLADLVDFNNHADAVLS